MEHLYHGYKWSSTQHSSQVILRPTSNHHQMECPCCSTCFLFHGIIFYSWCLCTSTKYDHHWKKTRLLARIRVVCPFLQLETPIFFCFSNEQIGHSISQLNHILVGGFNPSEKYESQLGWLFPIYGKIKIMFQTTNQHFFLLESSQFMSNPKKTCSLNRPGISWGAHGLFHATLRPVGAGRPVTKGHRRREVENNRHTSPPRGAATNVTTLVYGLPSGKLTVWPCKHPVILVETSLSTPVCQGLC